MPTRTHGQGMSVSEARALPISMTLDTANRALSIGRTAGYAMAKRGDYPVPLLRLGAQYRVRRSDVLSLLGVADTA